MRVDIRKDILDEDERVAFVGDNQRRAGRYLQRSASFDELARLGEATINGVQADICNCNGELDQTWRAFRLTTNGVQADICNNTRVIGRW